MSEYDQHDDERRTHEAPEARVHFARWSPWIWVVPALAIFFAGYLIVRYGFFGGGDITVRFAEARGLDRYSPVRFRGAKVGTVQKITIDDKLQQVVVRISMDASMDHALRAGTRFWVVEPGIEGGGLGGLLSGTYVGIAPGEGDETREFKGQEYGPVVSAPEAGKTVILEAKGLGSLAVGTPVLFQGMRVGRILGAEYDEKRRLTAVHAFVVHRFAGHVRQSTRFWRTGGLLVSLSGGGLSVGGASLGSLLNAPVAFYTPEVLAGDEVRNGTRFELHESEPAAMATSDGPHLTYVTYFPQPVRGLTAGSAVQMKGVRVGRVRDVRLRYVSSSASLETPVTIEIDPRLLEIPVNDSTTREALRAEMDGVLAKLVQKGMRATLASSLVLPGASGINLETIAEPNTGRLGLGSNPPIIPVGSAGSGIDTALSSVRQAADRIANLPLREVAADMRNAAQGVGAIVNDPRIDKSLTRLNSSLAEIEKVAVITRENIGPLTKSLRSAADSAEGAAKSAQQLIGGPQRQNYDFGELIKELTRAAEAVRALALYLEENPDSLLKGRGK
ncbi:MAG TPA: MlaD family protein [Thermoanaerobaculia bacterium]|nr:MlaD family protein [Thermoanaerobaculia bacterium]